MDQFESMSVKVYAEQNKLQPQLVHYYIRKGLIEQYPCGCCGSKVISVLQADAIFKKDPVDKSNGNL